MLRRFCSFVLVLVLVLGLFAVPVSAADFSGSKWNTADPGTDVDNDYQTTSVGGIQYPI